MDIVIERLTDLWLSAAADLLLESEGAGWRHVRRLTDEWVRGVNRFDGPGEALFGAKAAGRLIGVCGLNVDPYANDPRIGRVRHLYVLAEFRGQGLARRLLQAVLTAAKESFASLRLRTECPDTAGFYQSLGFHRVQSQDCTHMLRLENQII